MNGKADLTGEVRTPGRLCWSCVHFVFSGGSPALSDATPGYEGELECQKKVYKISMSDLTQDRLRETLMLAETCKGFKSRSPEARHSEASHLEIPRDKTWPTDAGQCDDCGGHGCVTCAQKGWLPAGQPKIRKCLRSACGKALAPSWFPVYCSNQCAMMDA